MAYETRIYVVSEYSFDLEEGEPKMGEELAMLNLCKCNYDGPLERLMKKYRHNAKRDGGKPSFAIYARNPERQQEAVNVLREFAEQTTSPPVEKGFNFTGDIEARTKKANYLNKLSNDIEDGTIITDCYGDYLSAIPIDEFIEALEEELKSNEPYRRFQWALVLLKSIKETWDRNGRLKVITYGY